MNDQQLYLKKADKANIEKALTITGYHAQEARKHLSALSPEALGELIGLTKHGFQKRINKYKEEVEK